MGYVKQFGWFRYACVLTSLLLVYSLFHYGAQPVAVGLFNPPLDKIAHAALFGLLAMMLWFVFDRRFPWLVLGLVALTATADEVHQLFLPGRFANLGDWVADLIGACLPLLIAIACRKKTGSEVDLKAEGAERTTQV